MTDWRPTASLSVLQERANLLARIRSFFAMAGVMEVDTPQLGRYGVTEPNIDTIEAQVCGTVWHLQSSPEYFMKRLLAAGSGPIYSLGKVFRDGERGRRHHPEFTLLEWYRPGWDDRRLMGEVEALCAALSERWRHAMRLTYREVFFDATGLDPHTADLDVLRQLASRYCSGDWARESRATCLDLLFSLVVEPTLHEGVVIVMDYPACQAALARVMKDGQGVEVARRFEVFIDGVEIGNGYFELTDAAEQRRRFDADIALRAAMDKPPRESDPYLLAALEAGLSECAGVAMGVDRMLMRLLDLSDIAEVIPFRE